MAGNEITPVFEPGNRPTCMATATVRAGRFVKISADIAGGLFGTENARVSECDATAEPFGVAVSDAINNENFPVIRGGSMILPMVAGAAVAAGVAVQSDSQGRAITLAAGPKGGVSVTAAASAGDTIGVAIKL